MSRLISLGLLLAALLPAGVTAATVDQLLARDAAPPGVVFEIVEGEFSALTWAIPRVNEAIDRLRKRYPELPVAVVSHGGEQFALTRTRRSEMPELHGAVQSLVESDVPVHVCGTHASRYGITPEDFPDYVDVAAAGPAQIRDYEALGYVRVRITRP